MMKTIRVIACAALLLNGVSVSAAGLGFSGSVFKSSNIVRDACLSMVKIQSGTYTCSNDDGTTIKSSTVDIIADNMSPPVRARLVILNYT